MARCGLRYNDAPAVNIPRELPYPSDSFHSIETNLEADHGAVPPDDEAPLLRIHPHTSMDTKTASFSLPRWRLTTWLCYSGRDVPEDIRAALIGSLFGTLPIFAGGVLNTIAVSVAVTLREPTPAFIAWVVMEVLLCGARLALLIAAHRASVRGGHTFTDLYLLLAILWGASVGYGAFISIASADWVAATLSCLSAAAMVGGICFRNFGAPRLVAIMILLSLGPCCLAAALSAETVLRLTLIQIPFYLVAMSIAAFHLNKLLVSTMKAERENDHRARHDALTGLPNRAGLIHASAHPLCRQPERYEETRGALYRPRRFQAGQRPARPSGRRSAARHDRRTARCAQAARRHGIPARRRRIRAGRRDGEPPRCIGVRRSRHP